MNPCGQDNDAYASIAWLSQAPERELDLARMAELGAALGITWASVVEREQQAWTPTDGAFTTLSGIPLTEFSDSAPSTPSPFQLATVVAEDAVSHVELARIEVVAPVSTEMHCDYCHYNPVKHGLAARPWDWPWSTFRRFVSQGQYPRDWGTTEPPNLHGLRGEFTDALTGAGRTGERTGPARRGKVSAWNIVGAAAGSRLRPHDFAAADVEEMDAAAERHGDVAVARFQEAALRHDVRGIRRTRSRDLRDHRSSDIPPRRRVAGARTSAHVPQWTSQCPSRRG